ncbi:iron ABC transporter substrate-binding protein [Janibacter sp. HTCC2649]|uniref:ABC transporter substrate-binding protein n=1 Tax=Janibacter sp. HTCC2649 TaxID=313589 RepID=UPI000066EA3F|nr:ABC transporter substrate-binding protein [Janibacter sp. HTCC2649]EAP99230.1 iron ABC transporter substrate-binding protein [Janibacter sp. HTCC2649]
MRRTRSSAILLAVPLGLTTLLAACAVEEPTTSTPGASGSGGGSIKGTGEVVVACTPQEEQCQAMAAAFTKASGIKTSFVRMSSGEGVARLDAAKSKPEFDVLYGGPSDGHVAAFNAGLIEPYVSPNAAVIPDKYKDKDGKWTGTYVGVLGFCSNKDQLAKAGVAAAPTSWAELLDPKLKNQVAMAHPSTSGTAYTAVWTQMVLNGMDVTKTFGYLAKLHNNVLQYSKSGSAPGQMAGRGEVAVGVIFSHDCVKYQKEGFDMLESTFPSEGTGYEIGAVSVVKGGPNAENAKKFIDWSLTPDHQNIGPTVGSFQIPTNPDAKITDDMVKLDEVKLVDYDSLAAGEKKKELTAKFDAEVAPAPKE